MSAKIVSVHVITSQGSASVPCAVSVSAGDRIAVERGSIVIRHGKRDRKVASIEIPPAVRVEV